MVVSSCIGTAMSTDAEIGGRTETGRAAQDDEQSGNQNQADASGVFRCCLQISGQESVQCTPDSSRAPIRNTF